MELMINIPDEEYKRMMEKRMFGRVDVWKDAICNGTPLPKGHGALKDANEIRDKIYKEELFYGRDGCEYDYGKGCGLHEAREFVELANTIIEADKEGEQK